MAKNNKVEISLEEKLKQALVPVDEQPYKLPDSWVWVRLGDIGKITSGGTPTSNEKSYYGGDIIWITPADMSKQQSSPWFSNSSKKITNLGLQKSSAQLIEGNSVVYSSRAPIGYVNIVKDKFTTSQGCKSVTPIKNSLMYIYYVLIERTEDIKYRASGTTFKEISALEFGKTLVPLPPLNEQKRIVEKLDFLFEKTKRAKEIIEEIKVDIENRKISILDRAFKGTLTSKWRNENKTSDVKELLKTINDEKIKKWEEDCLQAEKDGNKKPKKPIIKEVKDMIVPVDEQPYKLPDSWVWVKLGDIIRYTDNLDINKYYSDEQIINYVDIDSINNEFNYIEKFKKEKVKDLSSRARRILKKDFILYSSVRPYLNNFAIMKDEIEDCIGSTGFFVFKPIYINTLYIFRIFLIPYIKELYLASIKGFNSPSINVEIFNNTPIPLPPLEEQQEIVRVLDGVLENENKVKELLELEERIDVLEKSILHKAFKGELGTQNNSDESALNLLKSIL